jgi:transposase
LVPVKAGDRVKTDRRDAERLARSHRSGDLTAVWVPDEGSEALRDLVRAREAAKADQLRARHRLSKFLLCTGRHPETKIKLWTGVHMTWVRQLRFEHPAQESTRLDYLHEVEHMAERVLRLEQAITDAIRLASAQTQEVIRGLQALRGIAEISAVTIISELGELSRFENARQLMGYSGAVPSENSSGKRVQRGSITKAGNAHLRRIVVEVAWSYHSGQVSTLACASDKRTYRKRSRRLHGRRKFGLRSATPDWLRQARTNARSSPPWGVNCWASSGPSGSRPKPPVSRSWQHEKQRTKATAKAKTQLRKKQKPLQMIHSTQFEDRASSSRSKHEGESSRSLCDRLSRTRDISQRQLPTDQDHAVSTREYQTDQSSPKTAPVAAGPSSKNNNKINP